MFRLDGSLYTLLDMVGGLYNPPVKDESTLAIGYYTRQMIDAVDYLHQHHRFCHRDIKPANFLINSIDGHIKLTDFGTATDLWNLTGQAGSAPCVAPSPFCCMRIAQERVL